MVRTLDGTAAGSRTNRRSVLAAAVTPRQDLDLARVGRIGRFTLDLGRLDLQIDIGCHCC